MPTGPKHLRHVTDVVNGEEIMYGEDCRCMLGQDHTDDPDTPWGEGLSRSDAADIWKSNGCDPDYMFGYSEEELSRYL